MNTKLSTTFKLGVLVILASSLSVIPAHAALPVNTVNDGATIHGGTYFNTAGSETVFKNSAGTGIHLEAGQNIRGAEAFNNAVTGNGGAIHIQAPDQVVRLDGNIDVRGFLPSGTQGNMGDGGKVTVDAAYLFQNGNIYAGGLNGGSVQMNVGGMTMGSTSRIDATGQNFLNQSFRPVSGVGGNISINSTGDVSINKGAFITTNGTTNGLSQAQSEIIYGNNIVIIGNGVNMDGTLYAGNIAPLDGSGRGTISVSSTGSDADVNIGKGAILQSASGVISIISQRDIKQNGLVLNNGTGYFNVNSDDTPFSPGVQGFSGGIISLTAANIVNNTGRIQADGHDSSGGYVSGTGFGPGFSGGNGGAITVTATAVSNTGVMRAMGGNTSLFPGNTPDELGAGGKGGNISFVGSTPQGNGIAVTFGGQGSTIGALGTVTAPDPAASTNTLIGIWKKKP